MLKENDYDIRPMLYTLFTSKLFYSSQVIGGQIKSPVQLVIGTMRLLEVEPPNPMQVVVALEERVEQFPRLRDRPLHVVPEDLLRREAFRDRPRVDLPADRLVQPLLLRELRRPVRGRRDAETGRQRARIEVDRREVQLDLRLDREEMKSRDAVHFDQRIEREDEVHPVRPLTGPEGDLLPAHVDLQRLPVVRDGERHRDLDVRRIVEELVRRSLDLRVDHALRGARGARGQQDLGHGVGPDVCMRPLEALSRRRGPQRGEPALPGELAVQLHDIDAEARQRVDGAASLLGGSPVRGLLAALLGLQRHRRRERRELAALLAGLADDPLDAVRHPHRRPRLLPQP